MTEKRSPQLDAPAQVNGTESERPPSLADMRTARLLAAAKAALHVMDNMSLDDLMEGKDSLIRAELLGAIRDMEEGNGN